MKIRQNKGHVVHSPLSDIFQMLELGGSYIQKFDTLSGTYAPNRALTPFILKPQLLLSDPDETLSTGDYSDHLINVVWAVTLHIPGSSDTLVSPGANTYIVNSSTKVLELYMNVVPGNVLTIEYSADYLDTRRGEVLHFDWSREITTEAQTNYNCSLDHGHWKGKVLLSPFKNWGQFTIPVQMKYGNNDVPDADAAYQWQWYDGINHTWSTDFTDEPWYVSGAQTKSITLDQAFIQDVLLRVRAIAFNENQTIQYFATRLRRWYGMWEEDVDFTTGKYIFHDTDMVVVEGKVTNRQGDIVNPTRYFDMELFFAVGSHPFEHVGYGEEKIIKRNDLKEGNPKAGILVRELSAFRAISLDNGKVLCLDDGTPIFAQFPTSAREV